MASASNIMLFIGAVGLANVFGFFSAVIVFAVCDRKSDDVPLYTDFVHRRRFLSAFEKT